ncbi:MAG: undecaprenyl-phosphate glucose phosphotransferase [Sphaerochaetaceae bacterium]
MDSEKDYLQFLVKLVLDSIVILISWFGAYFLRFYVVPGSKGDAFHVFAPMSILVLVLSLFFLNYNKLYRTTTTMNWGNELQRIIASAFGVFLTLTVILYYLYGQRVSRLTIAIFLVLSTVLLIFERVFLNRYFLQLKATGRLTKRVLVIGHGNTMTNYINTIIRHPESGMRIIGQYDSESHTDTRLVQFNGTLEEVLQKGKIQIVVISYPSESYEQEKKMVAACYDLIQKVLVIPDLPYSMIGTRIEDFHAIPLLSLNDVTIGFFHRFGKRALDLIASLLGTIIISPFLLVLAILVKVTSPGPVLYRQRRVTVDGKEFWMLKFRSMADRPLGEEDGQWTTKDDPRITKFGKFIRKTSLDELPQLFNVIKGDMSLIGPRPERPELVQRFMYEIPGYQLRHKVKAGITGWAQVNGFRGDTSLEGRIEYDLDYIRNWSFLLDAKIFILTFVKGFVNKNAY